MLKKGFTVIELLIVLAIFVLLVGIVAPFFANTFNQSNQEITVLEIQQNLRAAQAKSMAGLENSRWGVYFQSDRYTLYKGNSYAARDTNYDQLTKVSGQMSISGLTEINFTKNRGFPNMTGDINVTDPFGNILQVNVNSLGRVTLQ
jgi:prepilin-type N-terminal cleavage/methylation domain-containing protein